MDAERQGPLPVLTPEQDAGATGPGVRVRPLFLAVSLVLLATLLGGCVSRQKRAEGIAPGWTREQVATAHYDLLTYRKRATPSGETLHLFIEGDGAAYASATRPATDPTPTDPVALRLAVRHPADDVLYIARPCQFTGGVRARGCTTDNWTIGRFAEPLVAALDEAIGTLMRRHGYRSVALYGYSGGGTMAALIAARRGDVVKLVTVAAVLDHPSWTAHFGDTPLSRSLNPSAMAEALRRVPQLHLVGADDKTVPLVVARTYAARLNVPAERIVTIVPGQGHECCWADQWPRLARLPVVAPGKP